MADKLLPTGGIDPSTGQQLVERWVDNGDQTFSRKVSATGGGGGGGPATIADGADVALGTTTDAAYASGAGTAVAILKGIFGRLLPKGQATMANSAPVVIASDQSALPIRLLTSQDQVTINGGNLIAQANLFDGTGTLAIRAVNPTGFNQLQVNVCEAYSLANWSATAFNTTGVTYGPFNARNYKELVIVVNATAVSTGVSFTYQQQDNNNNWINGWTQTLSSTGTAIMSCGPGYTNGTNNGQSLGMTGRLLVQAVGTSATITGTCYLRTN